MASGQSGSLVARASSSSGGSARPSGRALVAAKRAAAFAAVLAALGAAARRWAPPVVLRLLSWWLGLPRPRPCRLRRLGGLMIPGGAEGVLLSSFAIVRQGEGKSPTMLVRTPYSKLGCEVIAWAVASHGFNVVVQDCRGRYASTGNQGFAAFEDVDGVATVDWLAQQGFEWYDPSRVVMFGISYLGIVQWALVAGLARRARAGDTAAPAGGGDPGSPPPSVPPAPATQLVGITPLFAASRAHDIFFRQGAFSYDFYIRYTHLMTKINGLWGQTFALFYLLKFELGMRRHARSTIGNKALSEKLGVPVLFRYNPRPTSKFWQNRDYSDGLPCAPPALVATGWHDIMLEGSLCDYSALVEAHGPEHSRLLVGPWHHLESVLSISAFRVLLRSSLDFLQERAGIAGPAGALPGKRPAVRLWIMGERSHQGIWRDFSSWPPQEAAEELLLLRPGRLAAPSPDDDEEAPSADAHPAARSPGRGQGAAAGGRSRLHYDPLDPTPFAGGTLFSPWDAGEQEQCRRLAGRGDVVRFESGPLAADTTVVGRPRLRLLLRASRPHFDIFARLCDLHPSGRSYNVCDAVLRRCQPTERSMSLSDVNNLVSPKKASALDSVEAVTIEYTLECELSFAPTAKLFKAGHRIQLLISCGCFPRFARHCGDAEQALDDPLEVSPVELEVLHSEQLPSALRLPVLPPALAPASAEQAHEAHAVLSPTRRRRSLLEAAIETEALPQHHLDKKLSPKKRNSGDLDVSLRKIQSVATL